jgi:NADPH-dependent curcumin reductase CurA
MPRTNTQVLLARRPRGWPAEEDFRIVESPLPELEPGQFLVRSHFLSLDPYMRGRMNDAKSYAAKVELDAVMVGGAVGEVVTSRNDAYAPGDFVVGAFGWQEYAASHGVGVIKVDPARVPLSAYLGPVGMPGVTAYIGLLDIGMPKAGDTVVVSAAAGAVGSVVGQIAKMRGCRAVGIAGGSDKCAYVKNELGFDACVDYRGGRLDEDLRDATPDGIDVYFENVGGPILDAVLRRLNAFARIPLCGLVSQYNEITPYGVKNFGALLTNRVRLEGFIVSERMARWPEALGSLAGWVADGHIKYRETIARGIRSAPSAFIGMLRGENVGKQLVQLDG